jgi:hypothetical protein
MEDDVLGPRQAVTGSTYDSCARCGRTVPRAAAAFLRVPGEGPSVLTGPTPLRHPPEATLDGPPPVLCPACAAEVAAGEPFGLEPPDPQD